MVCVGDENISVLKKETVQVQASLLPWQADITVL